MQENLRVILDNINKYKTVDNVTIVCASKTRSAEIINTLPSFSLFTVGENKVQELLEKYDDVDKSMTWHFIGQLQTNKVKYIIDKVSLIESVDRKSLADEIDKQAKKHGIVMDVLAEINCGREENKGGIMPEDVESFCREIMSFSSINLRGFMTMAPKCEEKSDYLKYFDETYKLFLDIWRKIVHNNIEPVVSMGMSESFEEAILCGSNIVRIGRGFFEK